MSTTYRGTETIRLARNNSETSTVWWWTTTNDRISLQHAINLQTLRGTNVSNWPTSARNAVNGSFFPNTGINNLVNSFHTQDGNPILRAVHGDAHQNTNGRLNFQDIDNLRNPLDYLADPNEKTTNGFVAFGTASQFPIISVNGRSLTMQQVRWCIGGMAMNLAERAFDTRANFNRDWRWRAQMSPTTVAARTAIGYTGGGVARTDYVVAVFERCEVFDVRAWLLSKGVTNFGLNLDGGGSSQARANGGVVLPSTRGVPTRINMT